MKYKHIVFTAITSIAFAAIAAFMLIKRNADVMQFIEGQNTFLYTPTYFADCIAKPAGLLTWCGAYLTQFLYDSSGIILLCALWGIITALIAFVMKLPTKWVVFATIPTAMLFASNVGLEYWIFFLKTPGYIFNATIGIIISLLGAYMVCKLPKWGLGALLALVLYPFFGIYGLFANVLGVIFISKDKRLEKKHKWINVVATAISLIMPLIWSSTIYHTPLIKSAYTAGLPLFQKIDITDSEQYVPYIILFIVIILMAMSRNMLEKEWSKKPIAWIGASIAIVCVEAAYVEKRWYINDNYNCELEMLQHIEKSDWNSVLQVDIQRTDEPTRAIVMMRELALFKLGRLGDEAFTYRNGDQMPESEAGVSLAHTIAPAIYYNYGKINYCNRWLIEHAVDYGWSASCYKYLIKCAVANGEKELAEKYARLLMNTRNHKDSEEVRMGLGLVKESENMQTVKSLMTYDDFMGSDKDLPELYLLSDFANDTTNCKSIKTLAIHAIMTQKNLRLFWPHFFRYAELLKKGESMPRHFQEAAYLLGKSKESQLDVDGMPFDQSVKETYAAFATQMAQYNHLDIEAKRQVMSTRFSNTYFYYYYLGKDFTTY